MSDYQEIEKRSLIIIHSNLSLVEKMEKICALLDASFENYNWTGFYKADLKSKTLLLGPFKGAPTSHTKIPFGKGICGQVAESKKTFLVDDVSQQSNYISCSLSVKSEIVVPIVKENIFIGQIDIDSHSRGAFGIKDQALLEKICFELSHYF
tara:strand:+ start:1976 stop:2431 length:456 start_codon:yes stop_codon:yes gene_type:complete